MRSGHRSLLLGAVSLLWLAACGSSSSSSSSGPGNATNSGSNTAGSGDTFNAGLSGPGITGTNNTVVATAPGTVSAIVGSSQTVSVTFTSDDGRAISGFGISGSLGTLPPGWSGPRSFSCALVNTGSGCILNLTYAPAAPGSGTLTLDYIFVDNATVPRAPGGSLSIAYVATAHNNAIASPAPSGQINAVAGTGNQSVSVNFTTDDGDAATDLSLTTDLTALPPGWTSTATNFACPIVGTGSGCELALSYTPAVAGRGALTLNYSYTDDTGSARSGALDIPYASTSHDSVIATASPPGQINAIQKTGSQVVTFTFNTNDGKAASGLYLMSDLTALPPGWSKTSGAVSCSSVGIGNGCQMHLTYAPAALASGTLILNYAYQDASGTAATGSLNVPYAATTDDNVVGTASPTGEVNAVVGLGSQAVSVTFTTDDARPATALQLTNGLVLPPGWSSTAESFACSGIDSDSVCTLPLTYTPAAFGGGTLTLPFGYRNNAGLAKAGTVNIPYRATTNDNIVGTASVAGVPGEPPLAVRTGSSTVVKVAFTTDDGNPASALSVTSGLSALPAGWSSPANSLRCATVSAGTGCRILLTYAPTVADSGVLTLGFGYTNDAGFLKTGNVSIAYGAVTPHLYVADQNTATVSSCPMNADDSLAACTSTGAGFGLPSGIALDGNTVYVTNGSTNSVSRCALGADGTLADCVAAGTFNVPGFIAISPAGTFAYVHQTSGLSVCAISAGDGSLSGCTAAGGAFEPLSGLVFARNGTQAYSVHSVTGPGNPPTMTPEIDLCSVAIDGTLSNCTTTGANTATGAAALALHNGFLYVSTTDGALVGCPINDDATLGTCLNTAAGTNANGIAFIDDVAYVSTGLATVLACPVNGDGTLGTCATVNDASFDGTAGLVVR